MMKTMTKTTRKTTASNVAPHLRLFQLFIGYLRRLSEFHFP